MNELNVLHQKAMEYSDLALIEKHKGNNSLFLEYSQKSLDFELQATKLIENDLSLEPTRSVLFRSAASIAMDCGKFREAEKLVSMALSGNPPEEIAEELRDLLEQINFNRHLELKNVELQQNEMQLSIIGNVVGIGIALSDVFIEKVQDIERLLLRTVERKLAQKFREHGPAEKSILAGYSLFLVAPRPGSFTVTLRLGKQMSLPGMDISGDVIDEVISCLSYFNNAKEEKIKEIIPEPAYFNSFIGLAKRIAPDGENVKMVGLTKGSGEKEVKLCITRKQIDISQKAIIAAKLKKQKLIQVKGRLLFADARKEKGKILIIEKDKTEHKIFVPEGMMDDIVKPLWDDIVEVKGEQTRSGIKLIEINKSK